MRAAFPVAIYRQRAGVETLFSTTKRKLSARASGRSTAMQQQGIQGQPVSPEDQQAMASAEAADPQG